MPRGGDPLRYVSFESLLMTERVVRKRGNWLLVHTAGEAPVQFWLEFADSKTAKRAGGSLVVHLREQKAQGKIDTDTMYNNIVYSWFHQLTQEGYVLNKKGSDDEQ